MGDRRIESVSILAWTAAALVGSVVAAGCSQFSTVNVTEAGARQITTTSAPSGTSEVIPDAATSTMVSVIEANETADASSTSIGSADSSTYLAWYSDKQTDQRYVVTYLVQATDDLGDVYDKAANEFVIAVPFGMYPTDGRLHVWTLEPSAGASHPASRVIWPAACLGPSPDVDGDGLLDDCDPYPADGPAADFDGDGIANPEDNCPTIANPDQARIGQRYSGAACDTRSGVHASTWLVPASVTLESWNEKRAGDGLDPIVMPVAGAQLPPEVQAWCDAVTKRGADDEWAFASMIQELPDAYGLDAEDVAALTELLAETQSMYEALEVVETDETVEVYGALLDRMNPYLVVLIDSDLACDFW